MKRNNKKMNPYLLHIGLFVISLFLAGIVPDKYEHTVLLAVYLNYYLMGPLKNTYIEEEEKEKEKDKKT